MTICRTALDDRHARVVVGRHVYDLGHDDDCPGCLPCTEPHCTTCGTAHADHTCVECTAVARDNLHEIARLYGELPDEVEARGVESEAMMLLAPSVDPERWGHAAASALAGRTVPAGCDATDVDDLKRWLDQADADLHPMWVIGSWDMLWRDTLDHTTPDNDQPFTVASSVAYLNRHLTAMASHPHLDFAPFATALKRCRTHMEQVLHDGDQVDRGAPCLGCKTVRLVRQRGADEASDGWKCPRCNRYSNGEQYKMAVTAAHLERADWLVSRDIETRTGIAQGTVWYWASTKVKAVRKRRHSGRTVYAVQDVIDVATEKGMPLLQPDTDDQTPTAVGE